jgi:hypothetical protein
MNQAIIFITGMLIIWLLTRRDLAWWLMDRRVTARQVACFVGLLAAPSWLYETCVTGQWGMGLLAAWYTGCYFDGLWRS